MTFETLIGVLNREVIFEVFQAYDNNKILFDSSSGLELIDNNYEWGNIKNRIVSEFYPTDTRELHIFVEPNWRNQNG